MPPAMSANGVCNVGSGTTTLRGLLPNESRGDQPVSIAVMPETPLALAYVRSVAIAFQPKSTDPTIVERSHSPQAMSDALAVAVHQNDLMQQMHIARPNGGSYQCGSLGVGKYLVLVTTARGYVTKGAVSKYIAHSNKFEFFVAEAVVAKNARTVIPGRFYRLGETAGAS